MIVLKVWEVLCFREFEIERYFESLLWAKGKKTPEDEVRAMGGGLPGRPRERSRMG